MKTPWIQMLLTELGKWYFHSKLFIFDKCRNPFLLLKFIFALLRQKKSAKTRMQSIKNTGSRYKLFTCRSSSAIRSWSIEATVGKKNRLFSNTSWQIQLKWFFVIEKSFLWRVIFFNYKIASKTWPQKK